MQRVKINIVRDYIAPKPESSQVNTEPTDSIVKAGSTIETNPDRARYLIGEGIATPSRGIKVKRGKGAPQDKSEKSERQDKSL